MNTVITEMLKKYQADGVTDQKNAVKEIMQEIVLCGLSRAGFFKKPLFTAARLCVYFTALTVFPKIWIFP